MKLSFIPIIIVMLLVACKNPQNETEISAANTIVDLTHEFSEETVYWVTAREFDLDTVFQGQTDKGYYYSAYDFSTAEHGGTHIDAPIHFAAGTLSVDQLPLEKLIGPAIKINVSDKALSQPDYLISVEDFKDWENKEGIQIPDGSIVLLETGYSQYYPDKKKYLGTENRGEAAVAELHFPGL